MTSKTSLTTHHTPSADLGGTSHTGLSRHHGVLANLAVVGHLNQVIQLHTLVDDGLTHRRTVHTGVGTNLYIVLDHYDTNLRNLIVTSGAGSEAEAVGTNHTTSVDGDIVAQLTSLIDGNVGVNEAFLA